jgi:hypothetical protein
VKATFSKGGDHDADRSPYRSVPPRDVNTLIDPTAFRVPGDLGTFLQDCVAADPAVADDPAYVPLNSLQRQRSA